jgi:calcineurin-like phosphoesterase family protein
MEGDPRCMARGDEVNTWVISDTHFGHANIIKYCNRPFRDVDHMNYTMAARWIKRVQPEDLVYHLGDFGLTKGDFCAKWLKHLPGKKILILGNHDKSAERMMEFGFDFACESMTVQYHQTLLFLHHRPMPVEPVPGVTYVLHGHIHNSMPEHRARPIAKGELVDIPAFNINMSVELWNYEPVTLRHVLDRAQRGEVNKIS